MNTSVNSAEVKCCGRFKLPKSPSKIAFLDDLTVTSQAADRFSKSYRRSAEWPSRNNQPKNQCKSLRTAWPEFYGLCWCTQFPLQQLRPYRDTPAANTQSQQMSCMAPGTSCSSARGTRPALFSTKTAETRGPGASLALTGAALAQGQKQLQLQQRR